MAESSYINELFDDVNRIFPARVNVKRMNAEFLDTFVFNGKYPVHTTYPRANIDLPVGIFVGNDTNRLQMMGFDYGGYTPPYNATSTIQDVGIAPSVTHGVVAHGNVTVTVVAVNPFLRDEVFAQILSAYMSKQGRCWFFAQEQPVVHGYNVISSNELEFDATLDGKVNYLYTATLAMEFIYDISTTRMSTRIESIYDYVVFSFE